MSTLRVANTLIRIRERIEEGFLSPAGVGGLADRYEMRMTAATVSWEGQGGNACRKNNIIEQYPMVPTSSQLLFCANDLGGLLALQAFHLFALRDGSLQMPNDEFLRGFGDFLPHACSCLGGGGFALGKLERRLRLALWGSTGTH